jgi:hypothetical protein
MADQSREIRERLRPRPWDAERIATTLVSQRDRLVDQLPRELASTSSWRNGVH